MPDAQTDWCKEAIDLRQLKRDLATGQAVTETRFGEDLVKFAKADLTILDQMIREADAKCAEAEGVCRPRRRYAMSVRVRPY